MRRTYTATLRYVVEGIAYTVTRFYDDLGFTGSTVDAPCGCFGSRMRCHNTTACPWVEQRRKAA